jgi:hypothetical protein
MFGLVTREGYEKQKSKISWYYWVCAIVLSAGRNAVIVFALSMIWIRIQAAHRTE